jgi:hypothetical protein
VLARGVRATRVGVPLLLDLELVVEIVHTLACNPNHRITGRRQ